MPAVSLPDVTLIVIDSVAHDLTCLAIEDTLKEIAPAEVLVFSDRLIGPYALIPAELRSYDDVARTLWYEVPKHINTSHVLVVQYDGWVLDGDAWRPEWLDYDYIGAPWWYTDGYNVGNGGFSLRSMALMRWLAAHPGRYPTLHPEDDTLCRKYRRLLEFDGFTWASQAEASQFSFERTLPRPTFGFHGAYHWPLVLSRDRLLRRIELASEHVRSKIDWTEMMAAARQVLAA